MGEEYDYYDYPEIYFSSQDAALDILNQLKDVAFRVGFVTMQYYVCACQISLYTNLMRGEYASCAKTIRAATYGWEPDDLEKAVVKRRKRPDSEEEWFIEFNHAPRYVGRTQPPLSSD